MTRTPTDPAAAPPALPDDLVGDAEAARALGVAPSTLKAARGGRLHRNPLSELPYVRIGRVVRYRRRDLIEFAERHLIRPRR